MRVSVPSKVKNPWACENDPHGSGFMGMELEIYLCPRCGAHPSMVDEDSVWQGGGTGLLCMECGFQGDMPGPCPRCGSENVQRLRRVTGYLTGDYKTAFNKGKQDEVEHRVKHNGLEA